MSLVLQTRGSLLDLHCSVCLTEWDLDQELRLQITTDQDDKACEQLFVQKPSLRGSRRKDDFIWYDKTSDTFVRPSLWLMVNPNIACPLPAQAPPPIVPLAPPPAVLDSNSQHALLREERVKSSSNQSSVGAQVFSCETVKSRRKPRTNISKQRSERWTSVCGPWPRPPVNYCLLIGLALKYSGSLRVQQIYNFTRELFPFFQTAPDGWKNTIRHNLCFNSSFRKTLIQSRSDGKRKSCSWLLTSDGHRRLKDELETLTGETLCQLERSAANPDLIQTLLSL